MLKNLTNSFKNACNDISLVYSEYVVLNNTIIPVKAKLKDDCYENGNFVGSFIFKQVSFEVDNTYDFKNKEFEYYKKVNNESVKIGTFITTEVEDNDTTEIMKVVGMDYGLKTQIEYSSSLDYSSGEITLKDVWDECCTLSGLTAGTTTFINNDFIVDSDQFTGTGALIRDVFKGIALSTASFVKIMNDDKIYLCFAEQTNDIIEEYTDLQDKRDTHPLTCVRLGLSNIDGESVDLKDDALVAQYGENWLVINDNPFAYTEAKRNELITAILNKVKGFGYSAFKSKTSFKPYLTCGDVVKFRNRNGVLVNSIILRYTHDYDKITLEAPSETSAVINYIRPMPEVNAIKRTEIQVDKSNLKIDATIEEVNNNSSNIVQMQGSIDGINSIVETTRDNISTNYYTKDEIDNNEQTQNNNISTQITNAVQTSQSATQFQIDVINNTLENGVSKVRTDKGFTFNDEGMTIDSTDSKTKSNTDTNGFTVTDKTSYTDTELMFAGYDEDLQQALVRVANLYLTKYLVLSHWRLEEIEDPIYGKGIGFFYMGG